MPAKTTLLKAASILFAGSIVGSFFNYIFQILMGRMLSLEDYGAMNSLISLFMITAVPGFTITMVIAKYMSTFKANQEKENISGIFYSFLKMILICISAGFFVFLLLSTHIRAYLHIPSVTPIIILGLGLMTAFINPVNIGALQGLQHFKFLSITLGMGGITRVTFALILVYLGFGLNGVMTAMALAGVSIFWLTFLYLRRKEDITAISKAKLLKIKYRDEILKYGAPVLFATIIFSILSQVDMMLVKHYFSAQQAGIYASAAVLGRAILYLPAAIIIALFPLVSELHSLNKDTFHILKKGIAYTALLSGAGVLTFWIIPEFLLGFLFGQRFVAASPLLGVFGLAMFPLALLGILINFNLARHQFKFIYTILSGAIIQITLIHFYHQSLIQILWIMAGMGILLLVANLSLILYERDSIVQRITVRRKLAEGNLKRNYV